MVVGMSKLDKLVERANKLKELKPDEHTFHVVVKGYCYSCKGKCLYEDTSAVIPYSEHGYLVEAPYSKYVLDDVPDEELRAIIELLEESLKGGE